MAFDIDSGSATDRGRRDRNEDFAGLARGPASDGQPALVAALADGVSHGGAGREAAQTTVISLLADFFATPATWDTTVVLDRLVSAQNAWLAANNRRREGGDARSALTTLSALVLQGQAYTIGHVGDTRVWRLAGGQIEQLTQDHALAHGDLRSRLTRALGLDDTVHIDFLQGEVTVGDTFVITSDGVHGVLKMRALGELAVQGTAQQAAQALVDAALAAGSRDNATAVVLRVLGLDAARLGGETARLNALPPLPRLRVGDSVDGYVITAQVASNGVNRLYQARETATQALVAIKTLHEARAHDAEDRAGLAHEAWLSARVTERDARGFVRPRAAPGATALYTVYDWHPGQTLEQLLAGGRTLAVEPLVTAAIELTRALGRLHRQGVIHRDVKPGNLHQSEDGSWRLLDLGVALSGRESPALRQLHAGTPSYINPEQWKGSPADPGSDLFALGVTLYQSLAGRLPYGEIEPYQLGRYRRDPPPLTRLRPDVPVWLDHVVRKAVALDPRLRFETAEELLLALERGAARGSLNLPHTPLAARDPALPWKLALGVALLFNALLLYWLLFLPR